MVYARIRINVQEVLADIIRLSKISRIYLPNIVLDKAAEAVQRRVQQRAPIGRSRRLHDGVMVESGPDRRTIISTAPHSAAVEHGTRASPGRYVPKIDKRLVRTSKYNPSIGMHPGIKATHFFEKGVKDADPEVQEIFERSVDDMIAKIIKARWP